MARRRDGEAGRRQGVFVTDPESGRLAELVAVQPFQAAKAYRCPGCNQEIAPGTGHVVVVPLTDPDERRHWHRPCYERRARRPS